MRSSLRVFVGVVTLVLLPASVWAQAAITGVVKDASGGVLPGVSVEVTSPALIERVRTAVTDPTGQYRIVDLRPVVREHLEHRTTGLDHAIGRQPLAQEVLARDVRVRQVDV